MPRSSVRFFVALTTAVWAASSIAQISPSGNSRPAMSAQPFKVVPALDGRVAGDPAWRDFEAATDFVLVRPVEGESPSQKTEVYIGYSDEALYVGIIAHDDEAGLIHVNDSRRDSDLDDADSFLVVFDSMFDRQNGFVFGTNPAGMQYDGQVVKEGSGGLGSVGTGSFNLNWDGSWEVESELTESGWSAEMRIPFRTLRYARGEAQTWGVNFQRNIRRTKEVAYWAPLSRDRNLFRVSEAGTVNGISPPLQRNLKVMPYVLTSRADGGTLTSTETDNEFGFDIKYSLTPSLTLDATYNTDFAQVETDEQQINLDRFSLFFPEKRPFFLENAGQFAVGQTSDAELFFSRRIGIAPDGSPIPIDGGLRLSGKVGGATNVGLLYMESEAVENVAAGNEFAVVRVNQELRNRSSIGMLFVDRHGDGSFGRSGSDDQNQTYAIDGRVGIGEHVLLQGWAAKTSTPGLAGRDDAFSVKGEYSSAEWVLNATYMEIGEDFNPEVGFLRRSNVRYGQALVFRRIRPDDLWGLFEIRPHVSYRGWWGLDGFHQSGFLHIDSHWEWQGGFEVHTGYNFTHEGVIDPFEIVPGVTVQPGNYDHGEVQLVIQTNPAAPLNFSMRSFIGGRFGGDRVAMSPTIKYQVGETFSSELSYNYNDFDLPGGSFKANLARLRMSYSFSPKITLQALVQYNELNDTLGTNLRFSWLQTANSGLFLVYNEVDERGVGAPPKGREIILKYSHIFDVFR